MPRPKRNWDDEHDKAITSFEQMRAIDEELLGLADAVDQVYMDAGLPWIQGLDDVSPVEPGPVTVRDAAGNEVLTRPMTKQELAAWKAAEGVRDE